MISAAHPVLFRWKNREEWGWRDM